MVAVVVAPDVDRLAFEGVDRAALQVQAWPGRDGRRLRRRRGFGRRDRGRGRGSVCAGIKRDVCFFRCASAFASNLGLSRVEITRLNSHVLMSKLSKVP